MANPRILLFGVGGLLGGCVLECSRDHPSLSVIPVFHSFVPPGFREPYSSADITDIDALDTLMNETAPDAVINLTCLPVGDCEKFPDKARQIQVAGAANLARVCGRSVRLIHLSTDMVYSGRKGAPYTEADIPDPISVYGRTKLDGEKEILKRSGNSVILRSALILGKPVFRSGGFLDWMALNFLRNNPVTLFTDQLRTPIAADDLAEVIFSLAMSDYRGVLLTGGGQGVNRVQMGEWLVSAMGKDPALIRPIPMETFNSETPLQKDLRLDSTRMEEITGVRATNLEGYVRKLGKEYGKPS